MYASTNGIKQDALYIDINNPFGIENRACIVDSTSNNHPPNIGWGVREVLYVNHNGIILRVTGIKSDGSANAIWTNIYNYGSWRGWQEH